MPLLHELWKKRGDVAGLTVYFDKFLGGRYYGNVYAGRLRFRGEKPKKVAVKIFNRPLDEEKVAEFEESVRRLSNAGVKLPKTGFLYHERGWVQVSELFSRREQVEGEPATKTKFFEDTEYGKRYPGSGGRAKAEQEATVKRLAGQWAAVSKAGYHLHNDSMELVKTRKGIIPYVIDLDSALWRQPRTLLGKIGANAEEMLEVLHPSLHGLAVKAFFNHFPQDKSCANLRKRICRRHAIPFE